MSSSRSPRPPAATAVRRPRDVAHAARLVVLCLTLLALVLPSSTAQAADGGASRQTQDRDVQGVGIEQEGTSPLPFDLPDPYALRSSPRKAFAHYVPWFPASIDNATEDYYDREYLTPTGESGRHAAYGGFLRDRPAPRPPAEDPDWRRQDLHTEVRQAVTAGLDGFAVDILQLGDTGGTQWTAVNSMLDAASSVETGFSIMLMPDMTGSRMETVSARTLATYLAELGRSPAAYRLEDGRLVIAPFTAERRSVGFWTEFRAIMKSKGSPVALLPLFQDERRWRSTFAPVSYGMTNWGNRNPAWNDPSRTGSGSPLGRAAAVQSMGRAWMQPVSTQDQRPREGTFDEAENTQNLRNTWQLARDSEAELVQIPTWNDYAEGSQIAPSAVSGWSWLDLTSYYLTWYKSGEAPEIVRDTVYLTHRKHLKDARPTFPQRLLMERRGRTSSDVRDTVEALTFLTEPGTVRVTVGSKSHRCEVDAGVDTCTVPLAPGTVRATVVRDDDPVADVVSPVEVTSQPYVQDMQYVASSSGRQSSDAQLDAWNDWTSATTSDPTTASSPTRAPAVSATTKAATGSTSRTTTKAKPKAKAKATSSSRTTTKATTKAAPKATPKATATAKAATSVSTEPTATPKAVSTATPKAASTVASTTTATATATRTVTPRATSTATTTVRTTVPTTAPTREPTVRTTTPAAAVDTAGPTSSPTAPAPAAADPTPTDPTSVPPALPALPAPVDPAPPADLLGTEGGGYPSDARSQTTPGARRCAPGHSSDRAADPASAQVDRAHVPPGQLCRTDALSTEELTTEEPSAEELRSGLF